jgi:hypothetical protein
MWETLPKDLIELLCCSYFQGKDAVSFLKTNKHFFKYLQSASQFADDFHETSFRNIIRKKYAIQLIKECPQCFKMSCESLKWNYIVGNILHCKACDETIIHANWIPHDHLSECYPDYTWKEPQCDNCKYSKRGLKQHLGQLCLYSDTVLDLNKQIIFHKRKHVASRLSKIVDVVLLFIVFLSCLLSFIAIYNSYCNSL